MLHWYGHRLDVLLSELMPKRVRSRYLKNGQCVSGYRSGFRRDSRFYSTSVSGSIVTLECSARDTHCFIFLNRVCDVSTKAFCASVSNIPGNYSFLRQTLLAHLDKTCWCAITAQFWYILWWLFSKAFFGVCCRVAQFIYLPTLRADCCLVIVIYLLHDLWQTECMPSNYTFNHVLAWLLLSKFLFFTCLLQCLVVNTWSWSN